MKWNAKSIKSMRERFHLRQHQFAMVLGARQQTVSEWEVELYAPTNAYQKLLTHVEGELTKTFERVGAANFLPELAKTYNFSIKTPWGSKVGQSARATVRKRKKG